MRDLPSVSRLAAEGYRALGGLAIEGPLTKQVLSEFTV